MNSRASSQSESQRASERCTKPLDLGIDQLLFGRFLGQGSLERVGVSVAFRSLRRV